MKFLSVFGLAAVLTLVMFLGPAGCNDDDDSTTTVVVTNAPGGQDDDGDDGDGDGVEDAHVMGSWCIALNGSWGSIDVALGINQNGDTLIVTYNSPTYSGSGTGSVDGNDITFQVDVSRAGFPDLVIEFQGEVSADGLSMGGSWEVIDGSSDSGDWQGGRGPC
jgi:hypothetical protein